MKNLNNNYVVDTSGVDLPAPHAPLLSLPLVAKICPKSGSLVATPKNVYCICKRRPLLRTFWNASIRVADFPKLGFFADFLNNLFNLAGILRGNSEAARGPPPAPPPVRHLRVNEP